MRFEWDPAKATANLKRHRVSFHDAAAVLEDPLSTTFPDKAHSTDEVRFITIGATRQGGVPVVAHTEREDVIRIISARRATRREREFYAQE